ncbi:MAG: hypothetical protein EPN23_06405 [Verrucomicrobia bacterium]|nr:MAG: hypothetical protein EPN23_06405 [Verrucomicrobiota bacterium]
MVRYLVLGLVWAAGVVWACNPPGGPTSPPGKGGAGGGDPVNLFSGDEYRHIEDLTLWGGVGQPVVVGTLGA